MVGRHQLVQPFFYDGFAVAARNSYYLQIELASVPGSKRLHSAQYIIYQQKISLRHLYLGAMAHHKVAHAGSVSFGDKLVAVAATAQREKQCFGCVIDAATVSYQHTNAIIVRNGAVG